MDVAFHCGQQDLASLGGTAGLPAGLDIGLEYAYGLFHRTGGLHHLGQEHFSLAEELSDGVHACHQRAFDDIDSLGIFLKRLLQVFF